MPPSVGKLIFHFLICCFPFVHAVHAEAASFDESPGERLPFNEPGASYQARLWQEGDGLPHSAISAVVQTRDGYVWAGTPGGLARFDGVRFTVFNAKNTQDLKEQAVRCLYETRDGTLWIGLEKGGLVFFKDGQFERGPLPPDAAVRLLFESRDGTLWIGVLEGLARFKDGVCTWLTEDEGWTGGVPLAMCEDRDGNLWLGTNDKLLVYKDGFKVPYPNYPEGGTSIRALYFDSENSLWVGTGGSGLQRIRNGKFTDFKKKQGLADNFVSEIFEDSRGVLWAGTWGGLCRLEGERFVSESGGMEMSFETPFYCMTEDKEGHLWLGAKEGLIQLQVKPFKTYARRQGVSHNNVMSVCEDSHGNIWLPTWGGGLTGINKSEGKTIAYHRGNSPLYDLVLSVCETRDGSLWLGADFNGGLFQFKDGVFTHYGKSHGLIDPAVRVIYQNRQGDIWVGTSGALYRFRDGTFQRFTMQDGLRGNVIRAILQDRAGNLWVGTDGGLSRFDVSSSKFEVSDPHLRAITPSIKPQTSNFKLQTLDFPVLSIHEDSEGQFWIGTEGGGLFKFKVPTDASRATTANIKLEISNYTAKDGLFSDSIFEILEDDRGNLWMSCFSGIFQVRKKDFKDYDRGVIPAIPSVAYGKADGMSSAQCNGTSKPGGWKGADGRLWFPTTRGVVVVNPKSIRENLSPPPVYIEQLIADKERFEVSNVAQRSLPTSNLKPQTSNSLVIKPGRRELEFHYTALGFRNPEKNRFKYKLEGVDSDWVDAGTRRAAYYNNIRPGSYRFKVIGGNSDGVWNKSESSVAFVLEPHFWETNWFTGAVALALAGLVAGGARFVTWKRVQARLQRIEKEHAVEKERTRIAQDMHDDLGARLTEILLLSTLAHKEEAKPAEVRKLTSTISGAARELVDNLDAIVWAVNPRNDSLDFLIQYLYEYVPSYLEPSGIRSLFDVPPDVPDLPLSSEIRHNLFLVVKEALHNVVKHSQASEARIQARYEDDTLLLGVSDNGKGFVRKSDSAFGNGLPNMEVRISKIGGRFSLRSEPGTGTTIEVRVPIRLGCIQART